MAKALHTVVNNGRLPAMKYASIVCLLVLLGAGCSRNEEVHEVFTEVPWAKQKMDQMNVTNVVQAINKYNALVDQGAGGVTITGEESHWDISNRLEGKKDGIVRDGRLVRFIQQPLPPSIVITSHHVESGKAMSDF